MHCCKPFYCFIIPNTTSFCSIQTIILMKFNILLLFAISLFAMGCHSHCDHEGHDHSSHDHSGHDHSAHAHEGHAHKEEKIITYTLWENNTELFIEFPPLIQNKKTKLRLVATDLELFTPLNTSITVHTKGGKQYKAVGTQKGVFEATITPPNASSLDLIITLNHDQGKTTFVLNQLPIAKDDHDAFHIVYPNADETGNINYARTQAWQDQLQVVSVQKKPVGNIIHTSGVIQPAVSNLTNIVAKSNGIVTIRKKNMTTGSAVRAGELLFTVTGKGIVEDDLEMNYIKAKSNLDRQQAHLERKKKLLDDNIVGQKEYDQVLNQYELAKAEFDNIEKLFQKGEKRHLITNTATGFVAQIFVQEGQFVEAGQPLAAVLKNSRVQVKIDVSPRYRTLLPSINNANFINPYSNKVYSLSGLDGKVMSFGRMTSHDEGHYIPMFFEINNHPALAPGSLVEAYLMTQVQQEQLIVPNNAILEEMGSYIVFIQKSAETFEKQVIKVDATDGQFTQVISGLSEGDKVVSKGALQIKLASMAVVADPHAGHNH